MKKLMLFIVIVSFMSCSNNKQIDLAKNELKTWGNVSDLEIKNYTFKNFDVSDRDAYKWISDYYYNRGKDLGGEYALLDYKESSKYLDLVGKSKGELLFHKIEYYLIQTDTIHKGVFIINEKDEVIFKRAFN